MAIVNRCALLLALIIVSACFPLLMMSQAEARTTTSGHSKAEKAVRSFIGLLAAGKADDAYKRMGAVMQEALPQEKLQQMWPSVEGQFGKFSGIKSVKIEAKGGHTIVVATCGFPTMPMDAQVVLDPKGKVVSFYLRPSSSGGISADDRPQTPKGPFPYGIREVTYTNPADKATFAGTLTFPKTPGPHPAVVLLTGSGSQDRNETIFGHKPFWVIADHLTRQGFVVLRSDDRGSGKTVGSTKSATILTHTRDAEAAVEFLKSQKEVDGTRIGLIGHSEGGVIASILAARSKEIAYIVLLAGTGLPGSEINPMQVRAALDAQPDVPTVLKEKLVAGQADLMKAVAAKKSEKEIKGRLAELFKISLQIAKAPAAKPEVIAAQVESQYAVLTAPWFVSFISIDPREHLSKVKVPVLALIGDKDTQVPADVNLSAISGSLKTAGNNHYVGHKLPGLNHLFQKAKTGAVSEYATIKQTFDPATLKLMTDWLKTTAQKN